MISSSIMCLTGCDTEEEGIMTDQVIELLENKYNDEFEFVMYKSSTKNILELTINELTLTWFHSILKYIKLYKGVIYGKSRYGDMAN